MSPQDDDVWLDVLRGYRDGDASTKDAKALRQALGRFEQQQQMEQQGASERGNEYFRRERERELGLLLSRLRREGLLD